MFFICTEYIFHLKNQSFFRCFYLYRAYFSSFLNMFFMLPTVCFSSLAVHVFYLSVACFILAHFLLIPCMLFTSLLPVFLVVCTHYFSRIYQSSLFFCSRIPSPPVFPYRSSQREHCFLHGHPSFALPLNPPLQCIYAAALSTHLRVTISIICVDWTGERNVLVCSFFYDGQCMFPITYHVCFSIAISNLLFPVICIIMSS